MSHKSYKTDDHTLSSLLHSLKTRREQRTLCLGTLRPKEWGTAEAQCVLQILEQKVNQYGQARIGNGQVFCIRGDYQSTELNKQMEDGLLDLAALRYKRSLILSMRKERRLHT